MTIPYSDVDKGGEERKGPSTRLSSLFCGILFETEGQGREGKGTTSFNVSLIQ